MALDALVTDPTYGAPVRLLANRLALRAATATSKLEARLVREADFRDAYHLSPPGTARGPDGDLLVFWRNAIRLPANEHSELEVLVGAGLADDVSGWLQVAADRSRVQGPLVAGAAIIRMVLEADDRAERVATFLSDVVLARDRLENVSASFGASSHEGCLARARRRRKGGRPSGPGPDQRARRGHHRAGP